MRISQGFLFIINHRFVEYMNLKKEYTIAWILVFILAIFSEFFVVNPVWWSITFVVLMTVEIVAVARRKSGDTLSEHMWRFQTGWARSLLIFGITSWICFRFAFMGTAPYDLGRMSLALGLYMWLLVHWIWKGQYG